MLKNSCAKIFLSDLIVIWRASVLFPDKRWVTIAPFLLWLGSVGKPWASIGKPFRFAELVISSDDGPLGHLDIDPIRLRGFLDVGQ